MSANDLLILLIGIVAAEYAFALVLELLNLRNFRGLMPAEAGVFYTPEAYSRARVYHREHTGLGLVQEAVSTLVIVAVLALGVFGWLDGVLASWGLDGLWRSLAFFALVGAAGGILGLPFGIWSTFGIEARYGFNKTTPGTFVGDLVKGTVLGAVVGGLLLSALILLIQFIGPWFWAVFALVAVGFSLFMNVFYTSLILPLFNKLSPLEDGELKDAIQAYARKVDFPLDSIMVMDGSKRSSKANAFFSGLGKKKNIVLFDTLIQKHSIPELVAVLAHEVGHYKKKHIISSFAGSVVQMVATLWILSLVVNSPLLSQALGGADSQIHLNLLAFGLLFSPVSTLAGLWSLVSSRRHEFEADAWAAETASGADLAAALKKLSSDNLGNPLPHRAYVFFHYTHPPVLARMKALEALSHP